MDGLKVVAQNQRMIRKVCDFEIKNVAQSCRSDLVKNIIEQGIESEKLKNTIDLWIGKCDIKLIIVKIYETLTLLIIFPDLKCELDSAPSKHSYYLSRDMMSYHATYSYHNYLEPIVRDVNDAAATNGRVWSAHLFSIAVLVSLVYTVLYKYVSTI